ncbi:hypothetical protein JVT61DRAFT_2882 [Boletus reticuloceps]|uniref:Uncharacterized protein n=1 Tax=Boletus reticuloceps TaxID=495285 RepID=A0A8I3A8N7_9AGAM|nr:hypothetical protein JVT61DRAFT_2882 [Boletus reticuloceps]
MDDKDLGYGPTLEWQRTNWCEIHDKFMHNFNAGVVTNGLQNRIMENVITVDVNHMDVQMVSLELEKNSLYTHCVQCEENVASNTSILYNGNHRFHYMWDHSEV